MAKRGRKNILGENIKRFTLDLTNEQWELLNKVSSVYPSKSIAAIIRQIIDAYFETKVIEDGEATKEQ